MNDPLLVVPDFGLDASDVSSVNNEWHHLQNLILIVKKGPFA